MIAIKTILEVKDVSFSYNEKEILKDITFDLKEGEMLGVLGPNGAGKTTLLRIISGALHPSKGTVLVDGKELHHIPPKERAKKMAILPQNEPLVDYLTVREMVMLGRIPYFSLLFGPKKKDEEAVDRALEMVGMKGFANRKMGQLSGGERQKVLIARALAQEPSLLMLDEPIVHLDLSHQLEILFLLKELKEKKKLSIVCVLHDVNLASCFSDKLLLLRDGRIQAYGEPQEVITPDNLKKVFNIQAIIRSNPLSARPYISIIHRKESRGPKVHLIAGGGSGREIMERLVSEGYSISLGVVNVGDSDYETAESLEIQCAEEAPFAPISDEAFNRALELLRETNVVIIAPIPFGWGNLRNLELARLAQREGKVVLIAGNDLEERDFTNGKAKKIIEELMQNGARLFHSIDELLKILRELV
ncbi:ABC transporter ATP-binding protein [bacterium]|nr:ABC transporter ATP-binding protein [bacterium]